MFEKEETKKKTEVKKKVKGMQTILPLRDFRIKFNEHDIKIKEGVEIEIPEIFIVNLKTEKVI